MDIKSLYEKQTYMDFYGGDVVISAVLILITIGITSYSTYHSTLAQIRGNWNKNRCNPVYMPFAGVIMPQPGKSAMDVNFENFSHCIKIDTSAVFSIAMIPFEFAIFLVIEFIDVIMYAIVSFMKFIQWLKNVLGGIFAKLYSKLVTFIVPLIEMIIHLRDALAKINGIMVTALFTAMNIYNTTVSGLMNIMTILNNLMITVIAVMLALVVLAFALIPTPIFPVGISLYIGAMVIMASIIIPTIVIYTLMSTFTREVMRENAPQGQDTPKVRKRGRR
jgi:hypothetical protein